MIDFSFLFAHIMSEKKIASYYLKKIGIFISNIYYHTKTNSDNKNFILTRIAVTFSYHISIKMRVITITTSTFVFIGTKFISSIVITLNISKINICFLVLLLIILKLITFFVLCY